MYALHHTQVTGGEERARQRGQSRVCAHHTHVTGGEERETEPIKWMRSPHTSYRWRGERVIEQSSVCAHHTPATGGEEREDRANQVYALATHQLQVERERSHRAIKWMRSPHTSYRWRGERVIEPISVCAHHTPATGGEERKT